MPGRAEGGGVHERLTAMAADWYWEQDEEFRFVAFSAAPGGGIPVDSSTGARRWEVAGAVPLQGTWDEHARAVRAGESFANFRYAIVRATNTRYYETSGVPIYRGQQLSGYRGIGRDITDEWLQQQRLLGSQALLEMASKVGQFGAWSVEVDSMRLSLSEATYRIMDIPCGQEVSLDRALSLYPPASYAVIESAFSRCLQLGEPYDVEVELVTPAGRCIYVRAIGAAQRDATGRIILVHGALQEITRQKLAAEENRRLAEQLAATLDSLTDPFYTLDRNRCFVYVNAETCRVLQKRKDELVGHYIWDVFPLAMRGAFYRTIEGTFASRRTAEVEEFYEPLALWAFLRVTPLADGVAVSFTDITARKNADALLRQSKEDLEARVAARTAELEAARQETEALSFAVAHDITSPLSAIAGYGQMLEESEASLSSKGLHFVRRIRAACRQAQEVAAGVLALAGLGRGPVRREQVDLSQIAQEVLQLLRDQQPGRPVDVRIEDGLLDTGDGALMRQVLANLLGNAWKYTRKKAEARIEFYAETDAAGRRLFVVADNGAGFDPSRSGRLFKPFERLHAGADFEGTGIGLAMAQKALELQGGGISACGIEGQGATFKFWLGPPQALA